MIVKRFSECVNSKDLKRNIEPYMKTLFNHKLYTSIKNIDDTKIFMESHSFAVWDFMSLLKSLQRSLTCVTVPWVPRNSAKSANFINHIVVGEECDDLGTHNPENAISHFELYINSMKELGCDTKPILHFVKEVMNGKQWREALENTQELFAEIPESTFDFVTHTLEICEKSKVHEVASSFLFGREDPIPAMFRNITKNFDEKQIVAPSLRTYLERHIEVDSGEHGILAEGLINELCGNDKQKWREVEKVAISSINERIKLWDGVLSRLENTYKKREIPNKV